MGHVDHQHGAHLVGDGAHALEVDLARIGAVAGHDDQGLDLDGLGLDGVVVQQEVLGAHAVVEHLEHLARDVVAVAMGEVTAGGQREAQQPLVAQLLADRFPLRVGDGARILHAQLLEGGDPHASLQDAPVGHHVGVRAAVGLHEGVVRAEELAGLGRGFSLDGVHVVTAFVEAAAGEPFGVLVGEPVAHGLLGGQGAVVLRGDQLQVAALVGQLLHGGAGDGGVHLGHALQGGDHRDELGVHAVGGGGGEVGGEGGLGCGRCSHGVLLAGCRALSARERTSFASPRPRHTVGGGRASRGCSLSGRPLRIAPQNRVPAVPVALRQGI